MRNFTPSNHSNKRGSARLANKAGFFHSYAAGFLSYKAAVRLNYRVLRSTLPAQVDGSTAVTGGPLFISPTNVEPFHVSHRNSHPCRTGRTQPANHSRPLFRTRRRNGAARPGNLTRSFATAKTPGNPAAEARLLIAHTHQGFIYFLTACAVRARGNTLLHETVQESPHSG